MTCEIMKKTSKRNKIYMYQEKKKENKSKIKQNKNRGKCRMEKKYYCK